MKNGIDFKISDTKSNSRLLPRFLLGEAPICGIDLSEISALDKENLLPHEGMLLFYYDQSSNSDGRGFDKDKKYYRVEFLEHKKSLKGGYSLRFKNVNTYPDMDDREVMDLPIEGKNTHDYHLRMLGWPNINDNVTLFLELNRYGFDVSNGTTHIAKHVMNRCKKEAQKWVLLLEIDSISNVLSIGDAGSLYFYIREENLKARDFTKCYMIREEC